MNHKTDCNRFARANGLQAKGDRQGIVTVFNPKTNWVDCFNGWSEAHAFFKRALGERQDGKQWPWAKHPGCG